MEKQNQVDADIRIYNDEKTSLSPIKHLSMVAGHCPACLFVHVIRRLCIPTHVTEWARTGSVSEVRNPCLGQTKQRASERALST